MVGVGLTILWRYRLLAAFFASFGFQVTAFVLALLAIIFGCIQFWDSRRHSEKMELIARSMSTRYLGIFPKEMDEIIDLIDLADKELIIISDFVDYGAYSRPETYQRLFDAVMRARDRGVSVQWLVYSEGPAQQTLVNQFKDDFARISNDPKFINYFNYWRGIDKPHDHATFLQTLYGKENVFAGDLLDKGVEIRTLSEKIWLFFFMQDKQDAVFLFEDIGANDQGLAFRTRDAKLVETFCGIFVRSWVKAPARDRTHRALQASQIAPSQASRPLDRRT
jgi:hypothetical protein